MKRILTTIALAASLAASVAVADTKTQDTSAAHHPVVTSEKMKMEQRGINIMRDIQYARLTLFSGDTEGAVKLINDANKLLISEDTTWAQLVRKDKKTPQEGDVYVIINSQLTLAEDFTATPEKQKAIDEANKKLDKGDKKGAIEKLQLAGINISETQWLMPLKQTQQKVKSAQSLMAEGKYYEANLALKGAEDGTIMDTVSLH
ncbi:TPA: YfdX family protein [Escherichia coli]|nr:YfdX family protein [Escherichia coli]HBA7495470.1 YfdX family protein [Escherichia coli]HBA8651291.1 YfdX family protein [Escherichia coli]HBB0077914.1 YfdX family protein [Escherichia coli]HDH8532247.1 YfdX family protein [Escherichia coli]